MDREKVIKGTEDGIVFAESRGFGGLANTMRDVLALLKDHEAKQVNISQTHCGMKYGLCPRCEKQIDTLVNPHYCGNCGQELKWE